MVRIWHPSWFFSIMIVMASSWLSSYIQNIKLMKPQGRHDETVQGSSWSRLDNDTIRGQSLSGFLKTIWHYPHNSYQFFNIFTIIIRGFKWYNAENACAEIIFERLIEDLVEAFVWSFQNHFRILYFCNWDIFWMTKKQKQKLGKPLF